MTQAQAGSSGILCVCTATGADYVYGYFLLPFFFIQAYVVSELLLWVWVILNIGAPYFCDV